ncbi:hypothetical protein SeMB42_g05664 [Synchytrium endobioticum]|uniref:Secreted protein n=1 Tax=Synchytrium endobioticum TaxID=286115 RepID=A0A507CQ07_9FUNG|nr:hypothetical protein SeMB42_g05664 [Synchytrium endobioticum]
MKSFSPCWARYKFTFIIIARLVQLPALKARQPYVTHNLRLDQTQWFLLPMMSNGSRLCHLYSLERRQHTRSLGFDY